MVNQYKYLLSVCNRVEELKNNEDISRIIDNFLDGSIDYILAFGEYYAMPSFMKMGGKYYDFPSLHVINKLAKSGYVYMTALYKRVHGSVNKGDAFGDTRFIAIQSIKNNLQTGDEQTDTYAMNNYGVFRKTNYFVHSLVSTGKISDNDESRDAVRILMYLKQLAVCREISENIDDQIEETDDIENELIKTLYRNPILSEDEIPLFVALYSYYTADSITLYDLKEHFSGIVREKLDVIKQQDYISGLENNSREECLTIEDIDFMSGKEFEKLIAGLFFKIGYSTELTKSSGDQGVDIIAKKGNAVIAIQTKRYARKITNSAIQEVVAGRDYYHADKCMVITSSYFTDSAKELAEANNVALWDRDILKEKIEGHYFG